MKKMLFNAAHTEAIRVAIVDGRNLQDLILEHSVADQKKANIYKGKITRIEPSLEAAFVDYGQQRHGFLPLKEVADAYAENQDQEVERKRINDVLKEGQEILIQVEKEERGNKGAALSTFISLAGSYLVLIPNNPYAGGISRRIEGEERDLLRQMLNQLEIPQGMGVIIRTAGIGKSIEELQWDLNYLISLWTAVSAASDQIQEPVLIYQESNVCVRAIRDYMRDDVSEIWVDDETVYQQVLKHIKMIRPDFADNVKYYDSSTPLFTRHQIESQIEQIFEREVRLPSGGSIVLDRTEALIAIDINSAQSTRGSDIEETARHTNLEACDEIAKQLRLRDLGGLVVIDFIDMTPTQHQRDVENRLRNALAHDRARVQMGRISRFGMLEMSRQRLRAALAEATQVVCPRCHGRGTIRSIESIAISIMRVLEENASKQGTQDVHIHVPVDVATYLLNEKRDDLKAIEDRQNIHAVIIPTATLESPNFNIARIRGSKKAAKPSYQLDIEGSLTTPEYLSSNQRKEEAVLKNIIHDEPAPKSARRRSNTHKRKTSHQGGLLGFLKRLFTPEEEEVKPHHKKPHRPQQRRPQGRQQNRQNSSTGNRQRRQGNSNQRRRGSNNPQNRRRNNQNGRYNNAETATETNTQQTKSEVNTQTNTQHKKPEASKQSTKTRPPRKPQQRKPRANKPVEKTSEASNSDITATSIQAAPVETKKTAPVKQAAKQAVKEKSISTNVKTEVKAPAIEKQKTAQVVKTEKVKKKVKPPVKKKVVVNNEGFVQVETQSKQKSDQE